MHCRIYAYSLPLTVYLQIGTVAQWLLRLTSKRKVVESNPTVGKIVD